MKRCFNNVFFLIAISLTSGLVHSSTLVNKANLSAAILKPMGSTCRFGIANCVVSLKSNNPNTGRIELTNNSAITATNITATLPASFNDVVQDASACTSLAGGASCIIYFHPGLNPHAIQTIPVQGSNTNTVFFDMEIN